MRAYHEADSRGRAPAAGRRRGLDDLIAGSRVRLVAAVALTWSVLFWGLPALPARVSLPDRIEAGHQLRVEKRHPKTGALFRVEQMLVDDHGTIPLAGKRLEAAGRTADELAAVLSAHYARRERPRPRVLVRASRPVHVEVEAPPGVLEPGRHTVPAGTTLAQAIELLRPAPGFVPEWLELARDGESARHDLVCVAAGASPDPELRDGDRVVLLPRDGQRPGGFWLLGAVDEPGRRPLDGDTLGSLAARGVLARGRTVHVVRGWPAHPQIFRIPAELAGDQLPLEPDDMVLVSRGRGLLAECAPLAALVMNLARHEPVVLAASAEE